LLDAQRLEIFDHVDCVHATDEDDRVPGLEPDHPELPTVVGVQLDVDDAALDDEQLLEIVDSAFLGLVVVGGLPVSGLVREQAVVFSTCRSARMISAYVTPSCSTTSTPIGDEDTRPRRR
jgi:hypothetical protein